MIFNVSSDASIRFHEFLFLIGQIDSLYVDTCIWNERRKSGDAVEIDADRSLCSKALRGDARDLLSQIKGEF